MTALLSATDLSVDYGGVQALKSVRIEVAPKQIVGLIGPNGAGKTTFIDAITGFAAATGQVQLGETDLTGLAPHARARLGLGRTWQAASLFDDLTVRENLAVAAARPSPEGRFWRRLRKPAGVDDEVDLVLEKFDLTPYADGLPDSLSHGQRKLVGVARATVAEPRVLCLDEPAAGLDTSETEELAPILRSLADDGPGLLLIDHDMGLVLSLCDYVYVLDFGALIAEGPPAKVRDDHRVVHAYLGSEAAEQEIAGAS